MRFKITIGHILTSASILVVLITFTIGYMEQRASESRQRTFDFLLTVNEESGPIHEASVQFAVWIGQGNVFEDDSVSADVNETIVEILNYYDLISDSAMRGVIDEEMIILHLGGRMRSAYEMVQRYIETRRKRLGREGLYKPFQKFVTERVKDRKV